MNHHADLHAAKSVLAERLLGLPRSHLGAGVRGANEADPNILGLALGSKESARGDTGVMSVRIFVKEKKPLANLTIAQRLPADYGGVPVDVVEAGEFKTFFDPRKRHRPAPAGCSVGFDPGDGSVMAGTFGAVVTDGRQSFILSNNHVLANEDELDPGAPIYQPGLLDGGNVVEDEIAKLARIVKLKNKPSLNRVDAALAKVFDSDLVSAEIPVVGKPRGVTTAKLDMVVHKFGRTTDYTVGIVTDVDFTGKVRYSRGEILFEDQIVIRGLNGEFSDSGDSGSLIVERSSGKATGLLFAGGPNYTLANPIRRVLNALKVKLAP